MPMTMPMMPETESRDSPPPDDAGDPDELGGGAKDDVVVGDGGSVGLVSVGLFTFDVSPNRFRITVSVLCQSTGMPLPQTISPDAGGTVVSGSDGSTGVLAAITATSLSGTPSAVL